jgi:hypothetical protein
VPGVQTSAALSSVLTATKGKKEHPSLGSGSYHVHRPVLCSPFSLGLVNEKSMNLEASPKPSVLNVHRPCQVQRLHWGQWVDLVLFTVSRPTS